MFTLDISWDSLCTSPTQQTKRTECCVIGTPCSPEPRYLTLSTSLVLTTEDTLSTTTPELTVRIQVDIQILLAVIFVKWKSTVTACMNTSNKNWLAFSQLFPQKFAFGPFQLSFLKRNWKKNCLLTELQIRHFMSIFLNIRDDMCKCLTVFEIITSDIMTNYIIMTFSILKKANSFQN